VEDLNFYNTDIHFCHINETYLFFTTPAWFIWLENGSVEIFFNKYRYLFYRNFTGFVF
jgi:hypothetical protein